MIASHPNPVFISRGGSIPASMYVCVCVCVCVCVRACVRACMRAGMRAGIRGSVCPFMFMQKTLCVSAWRACVHACGHSWLRLCSRKHDACPSLLLRKGLTNNCHLYVNTPKLTTKNHHDFL